MGIRFRTTRLKCCVCYSLSDLKSKTWGDIYGNICLEKIVTEIWQLNRFADVAGGGQIFIAVLMS